QPEGADQRQRHERTQGEDVPMREVDQLDDAVDHRVAERDESVDRAVGQSVYQDLDEERWVAGGSRDKKDEEDGHDRTNECPSTGGAGQGATRVPECTDQLPLSLRDLEGPKPLQILLPVGYFA